MNAQYDNIPPKSFPNTARSRTTAVIKQLLLPIALHSLVELSLDSKHTNHCQNVCQSHACITQPKANLHRLKHDSGPTESVHVHTHARAHTHTHTQTSSNFFSLAPPRAPPPRPPLAPPLAAPRPPPRGANPPLCQVCAAGGARPVSDTQSTIVASNI